MFNRFGFDCDSHPPVFATEVKFRFFFNGLVGNLAAICLENLNEYYAYSLQECYARTHTEGSVDGKQLVLEFKRKYHFSRPDMMRLSMIKQMNGEKQINLDKR